MLSRAMITARKTLARAIALCLVLSLAACATPPPRNLPPPETTAGLAPATNEPRLSSRRAVRNFLDVVQTIEPVAEQLCRERTRGRNCDFRIVVDDNPRAPANAFQSVDDTGRPVIAFTIPLIAEARNADELAFIMAHEAAHHIRGHLDRQRRNATFGALLLGTLASGAGAETQASAQRLGAAIGARSYSKDFELEADALGTLIAMRAGYDPVRGAAFFARIPDPGNQFLGTHPANAARIATVQRVANGG